MPSYSDIEGRYCRCIMHVSKNQKKTYNPYAVCTASVYKKKGLKRNKRIECLPYYKFSDYPLVELKGYAKKSGIKNVKNTKAGVIRQLETYRQSKYPKKPGPKRKTTRRKTTTTKRRKTTKITVKSLHEICKKNGVKGHWGKNKAWLLRHCIQN